MLKGISSVIHPSSDLPADKAFWQTALGTEPYFDQPFYVGFRAGGQELGLDPDAVAEGLPYPVTYWHTDDIDETIATLVEAGATVHGEVRDIGQGVLLATLRETSGSLFGLIQNRAE